MNGEWNWIIVQITGFVLKLSSYGGCLVAAVQMSKKALYMFALLISYNNNRTVDNSRGWGFGTDVMGPLNLSVDRSIQLNVFK
jgi:hypothetical protein